VPVSVVIVAKNEARDIAACLESARWAEERLVVDTGSGDDTMARAAAAGARVLQHEWLGYAATKNWAFTQASHDWILSLDADERVSAELAREIRTVVQGEAPLAAYELPRRFHFQGRWLRHGGCYPDWQLRLFRRGRARYGEDLVHERLHVEGAVGRLRGALEHDSYPTLSDFLVKLDEYSTLWAQQAWGQGRRRRWYHALSLLTAFGNRYLVKGGLLDGEAGLTWALFAGLHSYFKYAKLAELERTSGGGAG
jgi:glycosyltransferase involved in cell wall biosynthesis